MQFINNQDSRRPKATLPVISKNLQIDGKVSGKNLTDAVRSEKNEDLDTYNSQEHRETLKQTFERYLEEKKRTGTPIPIKITKQGYFPDLEQISTEICEKFDVYFHFIGFAKSPWFMKELRGMCSAQLKERGLTEPTSEERRVARTAERKRQQEYAVKLENWLEELKKSGGKLRFNNQRGGGGADGRWISQQTGIPYAHLTRGSSDCCHRLKRAKKEIGVERFSMTNECINKKHTYQRLLDYGTDCRKGEVEDNKSAGAQVNNTRSALLVFIKNKGLTLDSIIGPEFGILFNASLQEAVKVIGNTRTRKQFVYEVRRWQKYYGGLICADDLPSDFPSAIKFLVKKSGTSYFELDKLNPNRNTFGGATLAAWVKQQKYPTLKLLPFIHKVEEYFYLPKDTLASKILFNPQTGNAAALRKGQFPEISNRNVKPIAKLLPINFQSLPVAEQKALVAAASEVINQNTNEFRQEQLTIRAKQYRIPWKKLPLEVTDEIDKLIEFKTSDFTPAGYKHGKSRDRWKEHPDGRGSADMFKNNIRGLFGILTSSKENHGGAVKPEQLSIALIALPGTWRIYRDFMKERHRRFPASTAVRHGGYTSNLTNPEYGWITQSPWLAERLQPIAGLLTEEEVTQAKADWKGFLQKLKPDLTVIFDDFKTLADKNPPNRDSHLPVLPILESEEPLKHISNALTDYQKSIPSHHIMPTANAEKIRNIVFLRILSETALRVKNMVNMTWRKNNTGHLRRRDDGSYHLEIPHTEFKNPESEFFGPPGRKHPYTAELSKTLIPLLDEYLLRCRPFLIEQLETSRHGDDRMKDTGFLFALSTGGKQQRISYSAATDVVFDFTREHLVYNPVTETGLKGVEHSGPHSIRHIVATHVLKETGSYASAGAAIQDSEQTAKRHYAHYMPADRDKRFRHLITGIMEEDNE